MNQARALGLLARHNIALEDFHGRTRAAFIGQSRTVVLIEVHQALSQHYTARHAPKAREEVYSELRRRSFPWHNDLDAQQFMKARQS